MLKPKSSYALNKKDRDAIVYIDANHQIVRLTRDDFDTEEEFVKWKEWSDEIYHAEEKADHIYSNHTVSQTELVEQTIETPSPEVATIWQDQRRKQEQYAAETVLQIRDVVTEKQFRRLWLYHVSGLTEQKIADLESVGQSRISKSLMAAEKRIKKFLQKAKNRG
ncbi:MAG: sigma-70 family RNA polymerase sigma factor [Oscillospiraceae bacterium]|nr:sigma-70 family RNA polymerase sigma factor [Oscillospiraceae bacterium]